MCGRTRGFIGGSPTAKGLRSSFRSTPRNGEKLKKEKKEDYQKHGKKKKGHGLLIGLRWRQ